MSSRYDGFEVFRHILNVFMPISHCEMCSLEESEVQEGFAMPGTTHQGWSQIVGNLGSESALA